METKRVKIAGIRKMIGQNLKTSHLEYPQTYSTTSVDMTEYEALKAALRAAGKNVSSSAFFIKAIATALQKHPHMIIRQEGNDIVHFDSCNAGVGVDRGKGLSVVVVKDVEKKDLITITREISELVDKLSVGAITMEEMTGSTYTISNLSMTVADSFNSILNGGECFIMGLGRTKKQAVVLEDGTIAARPTANIMLNINHGIIDGFPAQLFLGDLAAIMEKPKDYLL